MPSDAIKAKGFGIDDADWRDMTVAERQWYSLRLGAATVTMGLFWLLSAAVAFAALRQHILDATGWQAVVVYSMLGGTVLLGALCLGQGLYVRWRARRAGGA